jgi:pyruvate/2-oxoglutarate/acetoin dehydrogenase E1 component
MGDINVEGNLVAKEGQNTSTSITVEKQGSDRVFDITVEQHEAGGYARVGVRYRGLAQNPIPEGNGSSQLIHAGRNATIEGLKVSHERG